MADYAMRSGVNEIVTDDTGIDNSVKIGDSNDRSSSLRLESVLEYTSKIKAFLGLEDEQEASSSPLDVNLDEQSKNTEKREEIAKDEIPTNSEIEENSLESSKNSTPDAVFLKLSTEQLPDILDTDTEPVSDTKSIVKEIPDILEYNVPMVLKEHIKTFPDILEVSKDNVRDSSSDGIQHIPDILEENYSNTSICANGGDIPDSLGSKTISDLGYKDSSSEFESTAFINADSKGEENDLILDSNCERIEDASSPIEVPVGNDDMPMESNQKNNPNFHENIKSIEDTDGNKFLTNIAAKKSRDEVDNIPSQTGESSDFLRDERKFAEYKEVIETSDEVSEETPYQIIHIEEGLRDVKKSSDLSEDKVTKKDDNFKGLKDKEFNIDVSATSIDTDTKPSIKDLRRLSTEVVNLVLQNASDQVKVILRNSLVRVDDEQAEANNCAITSDYGEESNDALDDKLNPQRDSTNHASETFQNSSIFPKSLSAEMKRGTMVENKTVTEDIDMGYQHSLNGTNISAGEKSELDSDTQCGFGPFRHPCLQRFATAKLYLFLYSIIGILHGSYYTYLVGVLSTLEKRYAFKSKTSGSIMILDEITPLLLGVIVGHYAGRAHRPRMLSFAMFLSAFCCFASALPYFLYGTATQLGSSSSNSSINSEMCSGDTHVNDCDSDDRPPTVVAILLLMLGSFLKGFGNLTYYAIGLAYLDDSAKKKNTPLYLAVAFAMRLIGPMIGFLMSAAFLKYYENPFGKPEFGPEDPRWIGGWWMGFVLQGFLLLIFAGPIAFFPRRLPGKKLVASQIKTSANPFEGLLDALKRLARNPLYLLILVYIVLVIYGNFGFYILLPKYMENQFHLSASSASLFSGPPGIAATMVSFVVGGFLIWKFKPSAKVLTGGFVTLEIASTVGYLILMIPQCEEIKMTNFGFGKESLILEDSCNRNCNCSTVSFAPLCGPDGKSTYFSPCYAGCTNQRDEFFHGCSCVKEYSEDAIATKGFCVVENCWSQALAYIITLPILQFICSLLRVAHTMILLRSIRPEDKNIALGVLETVISTLAFIPFPILYGALVDSTCLVWEKSCEETGNCWFYDIKKFNYFMHGVSAFFCGLAIPFLLGIFFLSNRIKNLYDEESEDEEVSHETIPNI